MYNLTIPLGAYAPGQKLRYTLRVENQSMSDIKGYTMEFVKNMSFTAHTPHNKTRNKSTILKDADYDDICLRQMNRLFEGEFELPSIPPTTEGHCIIRITYSLELEMNIEGCHSNDTIDARVFIGNVPLREMQSPSAPPAINVTEDKDDLPNYMDTRKLSKTYDTVIKIP